jgi:hypothetical protein
VGIKMRNLLFTFCALSLLLCPSILAQQRRGLSVDKSRTEQRFALVIGNSDYEIAPLRNTVNDAKDMAQTLRDIGFEVIYKENISKDDMKRNIRLFGEKIRNGDVGLFYFAGHGLQVKGLNYLVPVDAKLNSEEEAEYECIEVGFILAQMESARNDMNIIILDACRNNPFARSFRSSSRGLAPINAPRGTLIAYATGPGSVASDGNGRNGIYTQELLRNIRIPNLGIEEVFKRVRVSVLNLTQSKQTPWESSSLTRDFYFVSSNAKKTPIETGEPSSPPINIGPTLPDKPKMKGQVVQSNFFTYSLQQCSKSGSTVVCDLVITNNEKDRRLVFGDYNSILFDDMGNQARVKSVSIANQSGMYFADTTMVSGVPIKARIGFEGISTQATKISLMTILCSTRELNGYYTDHSKVEFRDIFLSK